MSASSWLIAWIGLEVNLLAFLALSLHLSSPRNSESILKYFLVQALASTFLAARAITSLTRSNTIFSVIIFLSLTLKLGAAPFHFWVPQVLVGCSWNNIFLILTWQKVAPFFLIINLLGALKNIYWLIISLIVLTAVVGALGGLSQTSLRKILAFSSINHMGWMLSAITLNLRKWILYFVSYSIILFSIVQLIRLWNVLNLRTSSYLPPMMKEIFFISLLSFGGLPPFFGFLPKWAILEFLSQTSLSLSLILVFRRLFTLFFYLRIAFTSLLNKTFTTSHQPSNFITPFLFIVNLFGLSLILIS